MVTGNQKPTRSGLLLLTCVTMLMTGAMESMKSFLPRHFESRYGFDAAAAGVIFAAGFIGLMLASWLAGRMIEARGWKWAFVVHMALYSAGWWLLALFSPSATFIWIVLYFAIGFTNGVGSMICNVVGPLSDPARAGDMLGRIHFCFGCGMIAGPFLYNRIEPASAANIGWTWPFVFLCFGALAALLAIASLRLGWPSVADGSRAASGVAAGSAKVAEREDWAQASVARDGAPLRPLRQHGDIWLLGVLYFCYVGAESGLTVWYITLLTDYYGASPGTASVIFSIGFAMFTLARLAANKASRTLGYERGLKLGCAAALASLVWTHVVPGMAGAFGYVAFLLSIAILFPLLTAYSIEKLGRRASSSMGILFACGFAGGAASSWLIGNLQTVVNIRGAFAIVTVLFVIFAWTLHGLFVTMKKKA